MVLSVLFCAGAVPISDVPVIQHPAQPTQAAQPIQQQAEYVQFLEQLVGELSGVFASWVHQNPPPPSPSSLADMYQQRANTCRNNSSSGSSPLPDLIAHHYPSDKWNCSPSYGGDDLRMRRGMAPMRFRLDSVGSSVTSAASSAVSTPTSAASFFSSAATSPMPFDLIPPSPTSTTSSTISFFADYPTLPLSADMDRLHPTNLDQTDARDATDAALPDASDWRQVGRDLRGIADHFASTRRLQNSTSTGCQKWSLLSAALGNPLASVGPLFSALAVYIWWKLVRRLTA